MGCLSPSYSGLPAGTRLYYDAEKDQRIALITLEVLGEGADDVMLKRTFDLEGFREDSYFRESRALEASIGAIFERDSVTTGAGTFDAVKITDVRTDDDEQVTTQTWMYKGLVVK